MCLIFIDNIFRFTQAGSEVSALLGRMPSAVGYQPTLAVDLGELQERITSTDKGSITAVQCVYVPADDLTDPAPANDICSLGRNRGSLTVPSLKKASIRQWILWIPHPRILDANYIGDEHYQVAPSGAADPAKI